VDVILRRLTGDGHETAEIHQQTAVSVEHDDFPVRAAERQPQPVRGALPHGADEGVVQIVGHDVGNLLGGHVDRDDDLVPAPARERFQHFIPFHHG
jgi:hypothetical protein